MSQNDLPDKKTEKQVIRKVRSGEKENKEYIRVASYKSIEPNLQPRVRSKNSVEQTKLLAIKRISPRQSQHGKDYVSPYSQKVLRPSPRDDFRRHVSPPAN
jgi:hypothetical protein